VDINDLLQKKEKLIYLMRESNSFDAEMYARDAIEIQESIYAFTRNKNDKLKSIEIAVSLLKILGYPDESLLYQVVNDWISNIINDYDFNDVIEKNKIWRILDNEEVMRLGFLRNVLTLFRRSPGLTDHLSLPISEKLQKWLSLKIILLE
jgi:hypothetical protein